ncbi:hypothetical protein [Halobacteriovorax sp.]|uniref:hypothetical protein n=1 Tax=Halobacteriovorax sp. TaxID=2020862 RepID=UPI003AF254B4
MRRRKTRSEKIVLTDEQYEIMEKLASLGLMIKQICSIIGISHQALYRRLMEDRDYPSVEVCLLLYLG